MKKQQLCKDFLRMKKGAALDAMQASWAMNDQWDIRLDWHEFSDALEYLVRSREAQRLDTGADGFTVYLIR